MVRVNDMVPQPPDKNCADGSACDSSLGVENAACDTWKPGQFDQKIKWGKNSSSDESADLQILSVWDKFGTLNKDSSFDDLYQHLAVLELRAAEMELAQARSALQTGDAESATAAMWDAQRWFGVSEKDLARGVSAGAGELFDAPADGTEDRQGGGGCGDGGCGGSGGGGGFGAEGDHVEASPRGAGQTSVIPPTGNFTAHDGKIYDPSGREYLPIGVNITPYDDPIGNIDKITKDWNMNFIRLNCWDWDKSKPQSPDEIKSIVDEYTKQGVVVELEFHGPSGHIMEGQELNDAANWYGELAGRYKDNPNVWFGTPNEAGTDDPSQYGKWLNEEKAILNAIRDTGSMNMVMVNDTCWGQGSTQGGPSALERYNVELEAYGNVIAEQHEYNPHGNAYQELVDSQDKLIKSGWDAVVLGEVGTSNGWPSTVFDTSNGMRAAMKNAQVNRRGLAAWGFKYAEQAVPGGDNSLTKGGNLNGGRTEMGNDLWNLTHS